ncbi:ABC transporter substrate-binding protein [Halanaerobium sp.]|jgi:iron(III) transport system substrate-binding protein|uniref:ABC transporter substrate-binding protein n=1 Tax=Halanaerobium sp. TaxID=1895664 RepID=UPI000DE6CA8F|nr:ABC transporter substrate-binding protein [Halanaerobium sp.]PUU94474.1 MAG: ABC-type Fe3+ transport system,periplasmic component [Halanaerobium sp.]
MKAGRKLLIVLLLVFLLSSGVQAAEDRLIVYTALQQNEAQTYINAFENYSGIKTKLVRKSTGVLLNILRREKNYRPEVDILFGGPAELYYLAAEEDRFYKYSSPYKEQIPYEYMDNQDRWWGIYIGSIGFAVNTEKLRKLGLNPPRSWRDLANPKYKDLITIPNPVSSGTGYTILSTILQSFSDKEAKIILKQINQNIKEYTNIGAMASKLAALGHSAVGISFSHDIQKLQKEGYNLELIIPAEGTGYEIGGMAIIKDSNSLDQAKLFVDFMLSEKGQNLYSAIGEYRLPTNFFAEVPEASIKLENANLIDYNLKSSAINKKDNLLFWQQEIYFGGENVE